jgi:cytoskeletal protein CcmA (bactofilin family)
MQAVEQLAAEPEPAAKPDTISSIGADMSIVGKIHCNGPAQVFGRIEGELSGSSITIGAGARVAGELRGANLLIGEGAQVEGNLFAQEEVTILGRVKGTIRAVQVKLLGRASVTGDIFHQRLSIEEEASFDGSSRPLACG